MLKLPYYYPAERACARAQSALRGWLHIVVEESAPIGFYKKNCPTHKPFKVIGILVFILQTLSPRNRITQNNYLQCVWHRWHLRKGFSGASSKFQVAHVLGTFFSMASGSFWAALFILTRFQTSSTR